MFSISISGLPAILAQTPAKGLPAGTAFIRKPAAVQLFSGLASRYVTSFVTPPWNSVHPITIRNRNSE
jgi:hypothetical protein